PSSPKKRSNGVPSNGFSSCPPRLLTLIRTTEAPTRAATAAMVREMPTACSTCDGLGAGGPWPSTAARDASGGAGGAVAEPPPRAGSSRGREGAPNVRPHGAASQVFRRLVAPPLRGARGVGRHPPEPAHRRACGKAARLVPRASIAPRFRVGELVPRVLA